MGERWHSELSGLARRHEFIHDVRGRGQMIGIEFSQPMSPGPRRRWRALETARTAMFSQSIVVPLFQRFNIITQVAADDVNIIKLLPPLIAGPAEVSIFVDALDELLGEAAAGNRALWEFGKTMAKGALKRMPSSRR